MSSKVWKAPESGCQSRDQLNKFEVTVEFVYSSQRFIPISA